MVRERARCSEFRVCRVSSFSRYAGIEILLEVNYVGDEDFRILLSSWTKPCEGKLERYRVQSETKRHRHVSKRIDVMLNIVI